MLPELLASPDPLAPDNDLTVTPVTLVLPPLAQRLATAQPADRSRLLLAALSEGEPLELPGADLRGIDLRPGRAGRGGPGALAVVPTTVVLDGANLAGAMLSGAGLAHASLRGACLDGALLVGADLRGADLSGASLRSANLAGADLTRADISFADLRGASLLTTNLAEVTATGADLRETVLHAAVLSRSILRAADLRWSHLDGANLNGAALDGARFEGATLTLTNLNGARLSPATDFSYAFLHQARLDRTNLTRANLGGGVGEAVTDLALARGTYRALQRVFEAGERAADARWARCQAATVKTASHRPDRAWRYYGRLAGLGNQAPCRRSLRRAKPRRLGGVALFYARHTGLYLLGRVADLTTGYATSLARIVVTLLVTWLAFGLVYAQLDGVTNVGGATAAWFNNLAFSAAALTPVDAYHLAPANDLTRGVALLEGVLGLALLGALGYAGLVRLRSS